MNETKRDAAHIRHPRNDSQKASISKVAMLSRFLHNFSTLPLASLATVSRVVLYSTFVLPKSTTPTGSR